MPTVSSFSYNFILTQQNRKFSHTRDWKYFTNFENCRSLGEKVVFFSFTLGFKIQGASECKTSKIKFGGSLKRYMEKKDPISDPEQPTIY